MYPTKTTTWTDAHGNIIATASVRRLTDAEAEEHERTWAVGYRLSNPACTPNKYYTTRHGCTEIGGGPFDTSAEALALADRLNGGTRVNGRFVKS